MEFICFHLMPYRPLDMAERRRHRSAWVVLPNSLYDPGKGADESRAPELLRARVYLEARGIESLTGNGGAWLGGFEPSTSPDFKNERQTGLGGSV